MPVSLAHYNSHAENISTDVLPLSMRSCRCTQYRKLGSPEGVSLCFLLEPARNSDWVVHDHFVCPRSRASYFRKALGQVFPKAPCSWWVLAKPSPSGKIIFIATFLPSLASCAYLEASETPPEIFTAVVRCKPCVSYLVHCCISFPTASVRWWD